MSKKRQTIDDLIKAIDGELSRFNADHVGLSLREKVLRLAVILEGTRSLGVEVVRADGCDARGARERIRLYLVQHVGIVLEGTELEVVSGISEYGRRTRELRVQDGYKILTGASNDPENGVELKPTQYLLLDAEPDKEAARRWHLANRIRKQKGSGKSRIWDYLKANVGTVVTSEELAYVSNDAKEFGRRTRELRTEEGYAISTRLTGRPDLKMSEYVLESLERIAEPHDRNIPNEVQKEVYARDQSTCCNCGWHRELWKREDARILELHHLKPHVEKGENIAANLLVLCSKCHDAAHAGKLIVTPAMFGNPPKQYEPARMK